MIVRSELVEKISLSGKVAIITGGSSGIGRGTAEILAAAGAAIAIFDIDQERGNKVVDSIKKSGGQAAFYACDVTSDADCRKAVEGVIEAFNRIDVLFNNTGIAIRKSIVDIEENEWDRAIDVNLKGIYLVSRSVIPHMKRSGGGSIINTGSGWSLKGGPDAVSYYASKGGVLNLTRAMAIDHGKDNIRVNCVCPGDIDTPLLRSECEQLGEDEAEFLAEAADRPIKRVGAPRDVAYAVLFFASDLSTWVTGSHLVVDGGGLA